MESGKGGRVSGRKQKKITPKAPHNQLSTTKKIRKKVYVTKSTKGLYISHNHTTTKQAHTKMTTKSKPHKHTQAHKRTHKHTQEHTSTNKHHINLLQKAFLLVVVLVLGKMLEGCLIDGWLRTLAYWIHLEGGDVVEVRREVREINN